MKLTKHSILLFALLFACSLTNHLSAQTYQDSLKVLFVGNSYTYGENLPHLVSYLSEGTPTKLITRKSTVGGGNLSEHWHGLRGLKTREIIKEGDFDIVVLQNHSMSAFERPDSLMKYVGLLSELIREHDAEPYLYVTWARERVPQWQREINAVYLKASEEYDIFPVMVGDAWELAKTYRPSLQLHVSDGSHASAIGAYLTACMFVMEISGSLPERMPGPIRVKDANGETITLMQIDPLDGVFIKNVVEEVISSK